MIRGAILAAVAGVCMATHAAEPIGTITILEGDALIVRGMGRIYGSEGLRLSPGDIVETAAGAFMQLEFPDQTVAQFGPATSVMLPALPSRGSADRSVYMMKGWLKLTRAKHEGAAGPGLDLRTPTLEVPAVPSVVVLNVAPAQSTMFVERGDGRVVERGAGNQVGLKTGDYYVRKGNAKGVVNPGPMHAFIDEMPRGFRDTLPLRADKFKDKPASPREAPDFAYGDVEPWLKAEPQVRKPLMQRWRAKAKEHAFRAELIANLPSHPEWDPILFPEKYLPKPASSARAREAAATH